MRNPTKFGPLKLDTPNLRYEFLKQAFKSVKTIQKNQLIHRLIDGARWSVGPRRQCLQSRGGALASDISLAVRSPATTVTPTRTSHQAASIGVHG